MSENATVMETIEESEDELKNKIVRLTDQLNDVISRKKSANDGFNAEIKDLREMIKMTLEQLKDRNGKEATLLG